MLAGLLAVAYAALGVVTALYAALLGALGCYESCADTEHWSSHRDAWQWDVLLVLGLVSFGLAVVAGFVVIGRPRWALVASARTQRSSPG